VDEAHRDVEPPLHSSGVRPNQAPRRVLQPEAFEQLVDAGATLALRQAVQVALQDEVLAAGGLGSMPGFCPTTPITRRTRSGSRSTSCPSTDASPSSGSVSVVRILTVVDFPAPFGPSSLKIVPRMSTGAVTTLVDRLERAGYARRVPDPDDRRRVLIEVTPVVDENAQKIYGTVEDAVPLYDDYTDEDLELLVRFQRMGRDWLEGRLARVEALAASPSRPGSGSAGRRRGMPRRTARRPGRP
jgi:MarR family